MFIRQTIASSKHSGDSVNSRVSTCTMLTMAEMLEIAGKSQVSTYTMLTMVWHSGERTSIAHRLKAWHW